VENAEVLQKAFSVPPARPVGLLDHRGAGSRRRPTLAARLLAGPAFGPPVIPFED
jgi:hypothetical protein